jgi:hypothetical protein
MEGAVLQGVLIDEAIEVLFQLARDFGRSTGAGAVNEALRALVGKAMDPLAQRGIGKVQRVRDCLEALAFDDFTHRLDTTKDTSLFRLFQEGIYGGQGVIGKTQFESPHRGALHNKVLQKYENSPLHIVQLPSYRDKVFSPHTSQELLICCRATLRRRSN